MTWSKIAFRWFIVLTFVAFLAAANNEAMSQNYNNNNNSNNNNSYGNNNNNSYGNNDNNNSSGSYGSGVVIMPDGVLQRIRVDNLISQTQKEAIYKGIANDLRRSSKCRKISLNRLEEQIKANQGVISEEMQNLAGLTRIENVFIYPESGDIVIAGPAEGWTLGTDEATVGFKSNRPTLQLHDLVAALRAFPPEGKATSLIGCSIDPSQEGLQAMQSYLKTAQKPNLDNQNDLANYAEGIQKALGLQNVQIWGVSPKTHFAATLVAADYRMKLIGIGLEEPPVKMITYVEKSNPANVATNALVRWFFQPNYDCVVMTEDGLAMQLNGEGVNLIGEDELVAANGQRMVNKGRGNRATKLYAKSFTDKFTKIADLVPVYANLRNLIDMTIVAAYLQKEGAYAKTNWSMDFLGDENQFPIETLNPVQFADTAVNVIKHNQNIASFPTGGGVVIEPQTALDADHLKYDDKNEVNAKRTSLKLPEGQWWWD
ncbi:MAG: DUF1598 domain-containing protein [Planctomycetia bacterium]|nr:DUF1598 domain-containing protein [Planctomycetia bacterium]